MNKSIFFNFAATGMAFIAYFFYQKAAKTEFSHRWSYCTIVTIVISGIFWSMGQGFLPKLLAILSAVDASLLWFLMVHTKKNQ